MQIIRQTAQDVGKFNRSAVLQSIYFNTPITRIEVGQRAELSPATVTKVVVELLDEGIITESGSEDSRGGRPRTILAVNPQYGYLIGIEVGETHIQVVLFNFLFEKLTHTRYMLRPGDMPPEHVVTHIAKGIKSVLVKAKVPADKVLGVGIGLPGIIEPDVRSTVSSAAWGWQNVNLMAMLRPHFPFPFYLKNGAQAMALAEMWFGAGRGFQNLAVLLIGTGVGAGIISQGSLYRGVSNSAGEWGHSCIKVDGRECRCGSCGCIEAYVGAAGILAQLRDIDPCHELLDTPDQMAAILALKKASQVGNKVAMQVLEQTAHYLGVGMATLVNMFNPERIVLGGWIGMLLGEQFLPHIAQAVERYALHQPFNSAWISLSTLGDDAISMGAASLVLENMFNM